MQVHETIVEEAVEEPELTSLGNITFEELYGHADESPFNTEYKIKFIGKVDPNLNVDNQGASSLLIDKEMTNSDSNLESMPDNEIEFVSKFKEGDDDESKHAEELSMEDEAAADDVIVELVDMENNQDANLDTSATKPTYPYPLVPRMVADVFEENLRELLSDTLKNILPQLLEESVKKALPRFYKRAKKTIKAEVPNLILKPLNKEFNALNTMESRSNQSPKPLVVIDIDSESADDSDSVDKTPLLRELNEALGQIPNQS
nr:hypothetical protein [Tanacetum cinerariifolium]